MIITVSSLGGAPGATSWALLLASARPATDTTIRVVLEADPDGGVLGARYDVGVDPGAVSLVAACGRDNQIVLPEHGRQIQDNMWIVPGPELAETAQPVWVRGANPVARALAEDERTWIVDLGRLGPNSPVNPFADHAVMNILVAHVGNESLVQIPARINRLKTKNTATGLILVGKSGHPIPDLVEFSGADKVWEVPNVVGLPSLVAKMIAGGRARRHMVWRNAITITTDVTRLTTKLTTQEPSSPKLTGSFGELFEVEA